VGDAIKMKNTKRIDSPFEMKSKGIFGLFTSNDPKTHCHFRKLPSLREIQHSRHLLCEHLLDLMAAYLEEFIYFSLK